MLAIAFETLCSFCGTLHIPTTDNNTNNKVGKVFGLVRVLHHAPSRRTVYSGKRSMFRHMIKIISAKGRFLIDLQKVKRTQSALHLVDVIRGTPDGKEERNPSRDFNQN